MTYPGPYTEHQMRNMTSARAAIDAIHLVITAHPDLRLGQIISILSGSSDVFYINNETIELRAYGWVDSGELPKEIP